MSKIISLLLAAGAALSFSFAVNAATDAAKDSYKAANDAADATYKTARTGCDSLAGNGKEVCIEEAKAARTRAKGEAEAQYKNTDKARADTRKEIAEADYDVAKAKCDSKKGNDKDVCMKEAKAAKVAATADAKADKKVSEARKDANEDKREAAYKVAREKCDSMAGQNKDACVADAKARFNK